MRLRTRLAATSVAVLALLAPTAVAHADPAPANPIASVDISSDTSVYPVIDGYRDAISLSATVTAEAGDRRIRGSVVVLRAGRVVQSWPVTSTGTSSVVWNGRVAGKVVAGTYVVSVRTVDDDGVARSDSQTVTVSTKKRVKVSARWTYKLMGGHGCFDSTFSFPTPAAAIAYEKTICRQNNRADGYGPISVTVRGRISQGPVTYVGMEYDRVPAGAIYGTYGPTQMQVTGVFVQSGSGSNELYVCEGAPCVPTSGSTVFSRSGTFSSPMVTVPSPQREQHFQLVVQPGHDLLIKQYTVTMTYYVLR